MGIGNTILLTSCIAATLIFGYYVYKRRGKNVSHEKPRLSGNPKISFVNNINYFSSLLRDMGGNAFNRQSWTEQIVSVNDKTLIEHWRQFTLKFSNDQDLLFAWKRQIEAWGVKCDSVKTFTYIDGRYTNYEVNDGSKPVDGEKYKVLVPCWVLTTEDSNSSTQKTVLVKGIIEKVDNL